MKTHYTYDEIYGTLLRKNEDDTVRVYFVVECQLSRFKRWMFQYGWNFSCRDKPVMKNGLKGYEVTLEK